MHVVDLVAFEAAHLDIGAFSHLALAQDAMFPLLIADGAIGQT